ncbi:hypothetical protein A0H81_09970 [Grifola frondosa]|uniref:DUF7704 domain-containing protein n=1 Tax=Grifola frondosa TaxID=5627 RepID=A0A1C7M0G3_GRIFR|nr:hypothetical protein A0H81_09970 [Grifola frondosa]
MKGALSPPAMPPSALPPCYWLIFGCYEPLLALCGLLGVLVNPKKVSSVLAAQAHDLQAPWPSGSVPEGQLSLATRVTMLQLAHVVGLLGLINVFVLWAARKHLFSQPALQEKVAGALLTPLLVGDFVHVSITWWALGDARWDFTSWSGMLWATFLTGFSLMIPRIAWHLGIGRYVDRRDGQAHRRF